MALGSWANARSQQLRLSSRSFVAVRWALAAVAVFCLDSVEPHLHDKTTAGVTRIAIGDHGELRHAGRRPVSDHLMRRDIAATSAKPDTAPRGSFDLGEEDATRMSSLSVHADGDFQSESAKATLQQPVGGAGSNAGTLDTDTSKKDLYSSLGAVFMEARGEAHEEFTQLRPTTLAPTTSGQQTQAHTNLFLPRRSTTLAAAAAATTAIQTNLGGFSGGGRETTLSATTVSATTASARYGRKTTAGATTIMATTASASYGRETTAGATTIMATTVSASYGRATTAVGGARSDAGTLDTVGIVETTIATTTAPTEEHPEHAKCSTEEHPAYAKCLGENRCMSVTGSEQQRCTRLCCNALYIEPEIPETSALAPQSKILIEKCFADNHCASVNVVEQKRCVQLCCTSSTIAATQCQTFIETLGA